MSVLATGLAACSVSRACPGLCIEGSSAVVELNCSATDLTSVTVTGACAGDAGARSLHAFGTSIYVFSQTAGVCHVSLTFASGFTYETDVTFATQTDNIPGCGVCPPYIGPTQGSFAAHNPGNTCVDAGLDGGPDA
jgi:hypothetical protein